MANERSCCCSGLSKGWWWLLTLIGLPFLYYSMLSTKWDTIEKDIQSRTTQELSASGADWSHVEIERRGRDVLLTGTTATDTQRDNAIKIAKDVKGVRIVDSNIDIVALKELALLAGYHHKDGKLVLEGVLSSQDKVDEVLKGLAESIGLDNIVNKLTVSDKYADEGGTIILSGLVLSDDEQSNILSAIKAGSGTLGLQLTNNLEIDTAALKLIADAEELAAEKAEADKAASDKEEAEKLAAEKAKADKAASDKAGAEKLASEKVEADKAASDKAEAEKLAAKKAEADKAASDKAEAEKLAAEKAKADKAAREKLASEKVEADKAASDKAEAEKLASEKAEADKAASDKAEAEKMEAERVAKMAIAKADISACQAKLNSAMTDKTILFETNKANIKGSSFSLLKTMATVIAECRNKLPNAHIAVSGHTDSRGSDTYNLALSQRRADAVKKHLIGIGVSATIITSKGYGESQPVSSNDTDEGRTQNRRITFSVR